MAHPELAAIRMVRVSSLRLLCVFMIGSLFLLVGKRCAVRSG